MRNFPFRDFRAKSTTNREWSGDGGVGESYTFLMTVKYLIESDVNVRDSTHVKLHHRPFVICIFNQ